MGLQGLVVNLN